MFGVDSFLFVLGFMMFGIALLMDWSNRRLVRQGLAANGRIVDVSRSYFRGGANYYLQVTFLSHQRREVQASVTSSSFFEPQIGDSVDVLYFPDDPTRAWLKSEVMAAWPKIAVALLGLMLIIFGMSD